MKDQILNLIEAEDKASKLFSEIENRNLISPGKSENTLNNEIFNLAYEMYGIKKYWHKRIVRAGENTLKPYKENPPNFIINEDDIIFIDFGPIFDEWEADFGRTYVLGDDKYKHKLKSDISLAWDECKIYFDGSIKEKDKIASYEAMFVKALKIIGELISYHNKQSKNKHWENITGLLNQLNISIKSPYLKNLKTYYINKNKLN